MKNTSRKKILLIDDDSIFTEIVTAFLGENYEVTAAQSGKEALAFLLNSYKPDLVLLDIILPEMNGWEIFKKIRGINLMRSVPIVFLTSLTAFEGLERAKKLGAADYITKPYDNNDLLARIEKILG